MLDSIRNLLILQDRDQKISQLEQELETISPQRKLIEGKLAKAQEHLSTAKEQLKHLESDRKRLEIDVEEKKQLISKYSLQQFQTKRNEEYRALAHEIETCKAEIAKLEDGQLEFMEQAERVQKEAHTASLQAAQSKAESDRQLKDLAEREANLRQRLDEHSVGRTSLAEAVEAGLRLRYERLRKSKVGRVVVGVEHSACGGCHMKLPTQIVVSSQGHQEVMVCPNCGRILFYTPDMDLAVAE
jgi:uncharacterized protein